MMVYWKCGLTKWMVCSGGCSKGGAMYYKKKKCHSLLVFTWFNYLGHFSFLIKQNFYLVCYVSLWSAGSWEYEFISKCIVRQSLRIWIHFIVHSQTVPENMNSFQSAWSTSPWEYEFILKCMVSQFLRIWIHFQVHGLRVPSAAQ